jgi:hypothetical protein
VRDDRDLDRRVGRTERSLRPRSENRGSGGEQAASDEQVAPVEPELFLLLQLD